MARILLGPLASAISGSVSGGTMQRTSAGHSARTRPIPRFRSSARVTESRQFVAALALQWRTLTAMQRAAWSAQASTAYWTNVFGSTITARGYWLFMRLNLSLLQSGSSAINDPAGTVPVPVLIDPAALAIPSPPGSGITVVSSTTNKGTAARYSVNTPPGSGGVILFVQSSQDKPDIPDTSTFTLLASIGPTASSHTFLNIYGRLSDGTEGTTIAGNMLLTPSWGWACTAYRLAGTDLSNPFGPSGTYYTPGAGPSPYIVNMPGLILSRLASLVLLATFTPPVLPGNATSTTPNVPYTDLINTGIVVYSQLTTSFISFPLAGSTGPLPSTTISTGTLSRASAAAAAINAAPAGSLTVSWSSPAAVPAGFVLRVFASPGLSPGVSGPRDAFRLIATLPPGTTSPAEISAEYIAAFGSLPLSGRLTFFELQLIHRLTGTLGTRQRLSAIWS